MDFFKELESFGHYVEKSTDTLRRIIDSNDPSIYADSDGLEGVRKQMQDLEEEINDLKQTEYNNDDIMDQFEQSFAANEAILQSVESCLRDQHLVLMPTLPSMLPQPGSAAPSPRDPEAATLFKENAPSEGKGNVIVVTENSQKPAENATSEAMETGNAVETVAEQVTGGVTESEAPAAEPTEQVLPSDSEAPTKAPLCNTTPTNANAAASASVMQTPLTKLKAKEPESASSAGSCSTPTMADFGISDTAINFFDQKRGGTNSKRLSTDSFTSNTSTDTATLLKSPSEATDLLKGSSVSSSPTLFSPPPANLTRSSKLVLSTVKKSRYGHEEDMFPLMTNITDAEIEAAPKYLRSQIDGKKLNEIVDQLNDIVKKKRSEGCADDLIDLSMLEEGLSLGRMAKVIILVLIKLKRLATVHVSGKTFYKIVSGANA